MHVTLASNSFYMTFSVAMMWQVLWLQLLACNTFYEEKFHFRFILFRKETTLFSSLHDRMTKILVLIYTMFCSQWKFFYTHKLETD